MNQKKYSFVYVMCGLLLVCLFASSQIKISSETDIVSAPNVIKSKETANHISDTESFFEEEKTVTYRKDNKKQFNLYEKLAFYRIEQEKLEKEILTYQENLTQEQKEIKIKLARVISGESTDVLKLINRNVVSPNETMIYPRIRILDILLLIRDYDKASQLISAGAEVDSDKGYKYKPVFTAARSGNIKAMQFLIDQGADLHHVDESGLNAFINASNKNRLDMMVFLLSRDVSIRPGNGSHFLDAMDHLILFHFPRLETLEFLCDLGFRVSREHIKVAYGRFKKQPEIIQFLEKEYEYTE